MATPLVSAIVCSRNRREDLHRCLLSLRSLEYSSVEIIVVDDASEDGTFNCVQREFPEVRLLRSERNIGPAVGRNGASLRSSGTYLWFLDSDAEVVDPSLLQKLVQIMQAQPDIGAIGGEAVVDEAGSVIGTKRLAVAPNGIIRGEFLLDAPPDSVFDVETLASCHMFVRRDLFFRAGGFDPAYFIYYEDSDLAWRFRGAGHRLVVLGKTDVVHHFSRQSRHVPLISEARNRMYFAIKNFPAHRLMMTPLADVAYVIAPDSVNRLLRRTRTVNADPKSMVTQSGARGSSAPAGARLLRATAAAGRRIAMLAIGYIVVAPRLGAAIEARRREPDHLGNFDPSSLREGKKPE